MFVFGDDAPGPTLSYNFCNSSLLGKYQSLYPPSVVFLAKLAAYEPAPCAVIIAFVLLKPSPIAVPNIPTSTFDPLDHVTEPSPWSAVETINPCVTPGTYPGSPDCKIYANIPPPYESPIEYVNGVGVGVGVVVEVGVLVAVGVGVGTGVLQASVQTIYPGSPVKSYAPLIGDIDDRISNV